ncbi:hypothetical protein EDB19DRAFT_1697050 [Suillus lakei]|nr:hypothetical protein EDB19DRAFT_1697050 [Suillus lakei]
MSIPLPGTYKLVNANFKSNQLFDLQGGGVAAGTPIIGRGNAKFKSEDTQMLWTLQVVRDANPGKIVRFINVRAGTFVQPTGGIPSNGGGVVGGNAITEWLLVPTATLGQYSIQTTDGTTTTDAWHSQVKLQATDLADAKQAWVFA